MSTTKEIIVNWPSPLVVSSSNARITTSSEFDRKNTTTRFVPQHLLPCRVLHSDSQEFLASTGREDFGDTSTMTNPNYAHQSHFIDAQLWRKLCPNVRPLPCAMTSLPLSKNNNGNLRVLGRVPHRLTVSLLLRERAKIRYNNHNKSNNSTAEYLPTNAWIALKLQNVMVVEELPVPLHICTRRLGIDFVQSPPPSRPRGATASCPSHLLPRKYRTHPYWSNIQNNKNSSSNNNKSSSPSPNRTRPQFNRASSPAFTPWNATMRPTGPPDDVDPICGCCRLCGHLDGGLRYMSGASYCVPCDPTTTTAPRNNPRVANARHATARNPKSNKGKPARKKQNVKRKITPQNQNKPKQLKPVSLDAPLPTARRSPHSTTTESSSSSSSSSPSFFTLNIITPSTSPTPPRPVVSMKSAPVIPAGLFQPLQASR